MHCACRRMPVVNGWVDLGRLSIDETGRLPDLLMCKTADVSRLRTVDTSAASLQSEGIDSTPHCTNERQCRFAKEREMAFLGDRQPTDITLHSYLLLVKTYHLLHLCIQNKKRYTRSKARVLAYLDPARRRIRFQCKIK